MLSFGLVAACAAQEPTDESWQTSRGASTLSGSGSEGAAGPGSLVMGWSTASFLGRDPTAAKVEAQARAMARQLKGHGYEYILLDDFWYQNPSTSVDANGRWIADPSRFPNGLSGLADYVHGLGLKIGFYVTPGIPVAAVQGHTPIEGTSYFASDIANTDRYETNYNYGGRVMQAIDYGKPGAQAYVDAWAHQLASWGADFVKLDAVGNGNVEDVRAWSSALARTGRAIHFNVSHVSNGLDVNNGPTWKQYAHSWRVGPEVACACATQVTWHSFAARFEDAPKWASFAGADGRGDFDALNVANGALDGLTKDERRTYMTLWAVSGAPLYAGDDLTRIDDYGLSLLTNDEVIAIDRAGHPAHPISQAAGQQVWAANNGDGSFTVALFNLGSSPLNVTASWSDLGFHGAAAVRDVWKHAELGNFSGSYGAVLDGHASQLLKITPAGAAVASRAYEAEASGNTLGGSAVLSGCIACSGGQKIGYLGNGGTVQFNGVEAPAAGTYVLNIAYTEGDSGRSAQVSVNGGTPVELPFPGTNDGAWGNVQSLGIPVALRAGSNAITISNPTGWAPDIDRITVSGSGHVALVNRGTGKYLDVGGASTADGAQLVQSAGSARASQQWSLTDAGDGYFKVVNRNSGKLVSVPGTAQGARLIQFSDDGTTGNTNAQWSLRPIRGGYYALVSRADGQNADIERDSCSNDAPVVQWADDGGSHQQWSFVGF